MKRWLNWMRRCGLSLKGLTRTLNKGKEWERGTPTIPCTAGFSKPVSTTIVTPNLSVPLIHFPLCGLQCLPITLRINAQILTVSGGVRYAAVIETLPLPNSVVQNTRFLFVHDLWSMVDGLGALKSSHPRARLMG